MSDKAGPEATPIRDAATVIVTRPGPAGPEVLMGQRGAQASFMPSQVVLPGDAAIRAARDFNLAFITEVVLAEVAAQLARGGQPDHVPFFDNSGRPEFRAVP